MELDLFDSGKLMIAVLIAIALTVIFARRYIFSLLDPWIMMFINLTMILGVIIYAMMQHQILPAHFYYVIAAWFAFILGLAVFYKKDFAPFHSRVFLTIRITDLALKLFLIVFLINSCAIFVLLGIPFFQGGAARTISAYSALGPGYGILYYINWGCQSTIVILGIKVWLVDKRKTFGLFALFAVIIFNTLNAGSKSGYLDIILSVSLGMYYMYRNYGIKYKLPPIFKKLLFLLPFYIAFSFISVVNSGYESNIFLALIRRVIGAAEGPYYYFIANSYTYFHGLNLFSYHFSQILPYFGYVDRESIDLGVNLSLQSDFKFGQPGYGPNPGMFVVGNIAWHNFGIVYCFLIGALLSFFRYRMKTSLFIWLCLNTTAVTLVSDATLMPLTLFYILILSPVFFIAYVLSQKAPVVGDVL